jgi:hypothetical protein
MWNGVAVVQYFKELPKMSNAALFPDLPQRRTGA